METNEIIVNEEVKEITEEIVESSSNKGLTTAAGIGLALIVGGIAYKKIIKPILAKRKALKEQNNESEDFDDVEEQDEKEEIESEE